MTFQSDVENIIHQLQDQEVLSLEEIKPALEVYYNRVLTQEEQNQLDSAIIETISLLNLENDIRTYMNERDIKNPEDINLKDIQSMFNDVKLKRALANLQKEYTIQREVDIRREQNTTKACGSRNSKNHPAYTKEELVSLAMSRQLYKNKTAARKESIPQLCYILGLSIPSTLKPLPTHAKECGPRQSKAHPYVYTKDELIKLAKEKNSELKIPLTQLNAMTKNELCNLLFKTDLSVTTKSFPDTYDGHCDHYTVNELKHFTKKYNLPSTGRKNDLCLRIDQYLASLEETKEDEELQEKDDTCMHPINKNITIREHQKRVVRHMLKHRGLIAIHNTGSGKTLTAVAAAMCVLKNFPRSHVVFIAPLSLLENFRKELTKFGIDINSPLVTKRIQIYSKESFYEKCKNNKNPNLCNNTFLIVDEAQDLKSQIRISAKKQTGAVAAAVLRCAIKAFKVLLLTATPMKNKPSDIINLISMIDGISYTEAPNPRYFQNYVLENEEAFRKYFACKISMNLIPKGDDYPKQIDQPHVNFIMNNRYYDDYFNIQEAKSKQFLVDLYGDPSKFKLFYSALRRASLSLDQENSPKVQWTFKKLKEEAEAGRKSIVYSAWRESGIHQIRKLLDKAGLKYGLISGEISAKNREMYKIAFNRGDISILLLSRAGGVGLDLEGCNNVILMEPNWNAADDEQIIGRARRYKSHERSKYKYVNVWRLFMLKPKHLKILENGEFDKPESVDQILYDMSYKKKKPEIESVLERLEDYSIENIDCDCYFSSGGSCQRIISQEPGENHEDEEETEEKVREEIDADVVDEEEWKFKRLKRIYHPPKEGSALYVPPVTRSHARGRPRKRIIVESDDEDIPLNML